MSYNYKLLKCIEPFFLNTLYIIQYIYLHSKCRNCYNFIKIVQSIAKWYKLLVILNCKLLIFLQSIIPRWVNEFFFSKMLQIVMVCKNTEKLFFFLAEWPSFHNNLRKLVVRFFLNFEHKVWTIKNSNKFVTFSPFCSFSFRQVFPRFVNRNVSAHRATSHFLSILPLCRK